ncbi:hypothetical protein [Oceanobacillus jeddahense]|uniref:hypothetical protein n=1 Tax=Oceanobacillus jeddahense TaxID=1462527 RepID=UPI000595BACB|nr:hypothetical protein [Oceanobacillus jeddahense]
MKKFQGGPIVNKKSVSTGGTFLAVYCFFDATEGHFLPVSIRWTLFIIAIILIISSNFIAEKKPDQ